MKAKSRIICEVLREYKYCAHVNTVSVDMHVTSAVPALATRSPKLLSRVVFTSHYPPLLKFQPRPEKSRPTSSGVQRFPPATSPADRRACCVGCFAKMIDSFINNCS